MNNKAIGFAHLVYLKLMTAFLLTIGETASNVKIEKGQLILRSRLDSNSKEYSLDLREPFNGNDIPGSVKLAQNDAFFCTRIGIGISKVKFDGTKNTYSEAGNNPTYHYVDSNYFVGKVGTDLEAYALETIFGDGAFLQLQNSDNNRFTKMNTNQFKVIPERGYLIADGNQTADEHAMSNDKDNLVELFPCYALGQSDKVVLTLADGDRTLIAGGKDILGADTGFVNMLVVKLDGYYLRDLSTKVENLVANNSRVAQL